MKDNDELYGEMNSGKKRDKFLQRIKLKEKGDKNKVVQNNGHGDC